MLASASVMVFTIAIAAQIAKVAEPAGVPRPQAVRVTLCNERRCSRTQSIRPIGHSMVRDDHQLNFADLGSLRGLHVRLAGRTCSTPGATKDASDQRTLTMRLAPAARRMSCIGAN